ncbi:hypothetical protein HK104_000825 [Borealophlyctis nickersoniae]|nr:hypothetical protein HK104_000825 [Borealophlyctis nickersoniae]
MAQIHTTSTIRDPLDHASSAFKATYGRHTASAPVSRHLPTDPRSYVLSGFSRPQTTSNRSWRIRGTNDAHKDEPPLKMLTAAECARIGLGLSVDASEDATGAAAHHHSHEAADLSLMEQQEDAQEEQEWIPGAGPATRPVTGTHHSKKRHNTSAPVVVDAAKLFDLTSRILSARSIRQRASTGRSSVAQDVIWEEEERRKFDELWDGDNVTRVGPGGSRPVQPAPLSAKRRDTLIRFEDGEVMDDGEGEHQLFMKCVKRCVSRGRDAVDAARSREASASRSRSRSPTRAGSSRARLGTDVDGDDEKKARAARIAALALPKHRGASARTIGQDALSKRRPSTAAAKLEGVVGKLDRKASLRRASSAASVQSRRASTASRRVSLAPRPSTASPALATNAKPAKERPKTAPVHGTDARKSQLTREQAIKCLRYLHSTPPFSTSLTSRAHTLTEWYQEMAAEEQIWEPKAFSVQRFIDDYIRLARAQGESLRAKRIHHHNPLGPPRSDNSDTQSDEPTGGGIQLGSGTGGAAGRRGGFHTRRSAVHLDAEVLGTAQSALDPRDRSAAVQILKKTRFERTPDDLRVLFRAVRKVGAFSKLSDFILGQLCSVLGYQLYEKDRAVFRQGDLGTAWYIILSGSVVVQVTRTERIEDSVAVAKLSAGQGFGDLALINDSPRLATIVTSEPCELVFVEKADYNRIIKFIHEKEEKEKVFFLRKLPMFQDWRPASLHSVAQQMTWRKFFPGTVIIAEGQPVDEFFIIRSGQCTVHQTLRRNSSGVGAGKPPPRSRSARYARNTRLQQLPGTPLAKKPLLRTRDYDVKIGTLGPLAYFGEDGVLSLGQDGNLPVSPVTIRAARIESVEPTSEDAAPAPFVEVAVMKCFDAREKFGTVVQAGVHVPRIDEVELERVHEEEMAKKNWRKFKRESVVGLLKEWSGDPNVGTEGWGSDAVEGPVWRV